MKKIIIKNNIIPKIDKNVSCIGYFDGVHKGHQSLIKVCKDIAKHNNLKSMVICFEPDPIEIISKTNKKHILSYSNRLSSFENLGIDIVCVIKFNKDLMNLSCKTFISDYLLKMNIDTLVCGFDFSFGYKGKGNSNLLCNYINTIVVDPVTYYGKKISSTRIIESIINGKIKLSNRLLGYDYSLILKIDKVSKYRSKWLIHANIKDNSLVVPKFIEGEDFTFENGCLTMLSDRKYNANDDMLIVFNYEE